MIRKCSECDHIQDESVMYDKITSAEPNFHKGLTLGISKVCIECF